MSAIEAETVNANGVSVFGGIAADCAVEDDLTRDFGTNPTPTGVNPQGKLAEAVEYIYFGTCPTVITAKQSESNSDTELTVGKFRAPGGDILIRE